MDQYSILCLNFIVNFIVFVLIIFDFFKSLSMSALRSLSSVSRRIAFNAKPSFNNVNLHKSLVGGIRFMSEAPKNTEEDVEEDDYYRYQLSRAMVSKLLTISKVFGSSEEKVKYSTFVEKKIVQGMIAPWTYAKLTNPLFEKYQFDVEEFMLGSKIACMEFTKSSVNLKNFLTRNFPAKTLRADTYTEIPEGLPLATNHSINNVVAQQLIYLYQQPKFQEEGNNRNALLFAVQEYNDLSNFMSYYDFHHLTNPTEGYLLAPTDKIWKFHSFQVKEGTILNAFPELVTPNFIGLLKTVGSTLRDNNLITELSKYKIGSILAYIKVKFVTETVFEFLPLEGDNDYEVFMIPSKETSKMDQCLMMNGNVPEGFDTTKLQFVEESIVHSFEGCISPHMERSWNII